jgi:hypothetical protein
MYNWDKQTCVHNNLGIGIPAPNWFIGNTTSLVDLFTYLQHKDYYYEVRGFGLWVRMASIDRGGGVIAL